MADPSGAVLGIWQAAEARGAERVNEPGAWSWSGLNTRDPEGATRFYGEVFGWEPETMDLGGSDYTLFHVSGYVGGEPEQPVARDVVAGMAAMTDDRFAAEVPPHWSIDFWVDDVDATADRAAELGGGVVTPPYDTPIFRQAILTDPDGAAFSVSRVAARG